MKKLWKCGIICFILAVLTACGSGGSEGDEGIRIVESEPLDKMDSAGEGTEEEQKSGQESESHGDTAVKPDAGAEDKENAPENQSGGKEAGEDGIENPDGAEISDGEKAESGAQADLFTGEYNSYDTDEPNLEIRKKEDGTYQIQIEIFRLAFFEDGVGTLTENGLAFSATAPDGSETVGTITLDGDVATVTFDPGWPGFGDLYSYRYYKASDTPNMD